MFSTITSAVRAIGVRQSEFELTIERLLAELHHLRGLAGDLARERERGLELLPGRHDLIDEADALRVLAPKSGRR